MLNLRVIGPALLGVCLLSAAACGPRNRGTFGDHGYQSSYGYDVKYPEGGAMLLPPTWQLDNFRRENGAWVRKDQGEYRTSTAYDDNNDGSADGTIETFTYALRYENRVTSGVIWVRDIPISGELRDKDLRILMQSYVAGIAELSYETVQLGEAAVIIAQPRYVATIVDQGPAVLAGQPAYTATVSISDIEQIRVTPEARAMRVQLVIVRAPRDEKLLERESERAKRMKTPEQVLPVLVVAGYSSLPDDFDADLRIFHDLLGRVSIAGESGFSIMPPPPPAATAATTHATP